MKFLNTITSKVEKLPRNKKETKYRLHQNAKNNKSKDNKRKNNKEGQKWRFNQINKYDSFSL